MKRRKLPYIHILPRILIGVLVFGVLLSLLFVPLISRNILSVSDLADAGSPVPTATPAPSSYTFSPTPNVTEAPTSTPTLGPTQPPSDVIILSVSIPLISDSFSIPSALFTPGAVHSRELISPSAM